MTLPLHCMPPVLDWGLKPKEYKIPTEQEIVDKFSKVERYRVAYTSALFVKLLRYYIRELRANLMYPKKQKEFKGHSSQLVTLDLELSKDADKVHHPQSLAWLKDGFERLESECSMDMLKFNFATSSALLSQKGNTTPSKLSLIKALYMIDRINEHGSYISQEVAQRSGLDYQEFRPNPIIKLIHALLLDMAEKMDCRITPTDNMRLGLDIIVKKYLEILKV